MRNLQYICFVLLIAAASGCIPSQALTEGEIDRHWYLQADAWGRAKPQTLKLAGKPLPSRWVFRQEPSLVWSTVSIVRAIDKLKAGSEEFNVAVSPAHASMLSSVLSDLRSTLEDLREIADPDTPKNPERWASAVAEVLVLTERISRIAAAEDDRADEKRLGDPLGWSAGPMIQMLTAYLNERSEGNLLAGMEPDQVGRLREVLVQLVLRVSFAAAGKQDPPALRETIIRTMREAKRPETLEKTLAKTLLKEAEQAPPAKSASQLKKLLSGTFAVAPRMLELLEMFIGQWDRVDSMLIEFRRGYKNQPIVSVTLNVKPGRRLRLANLSFMQPAIVFRGGTRITVQAKETHTTETVVLFEPLEGGRAEIRFEGILYGLVRLLALPLDDAALREIRFLSASGPAGRLTSVTVLMDALSDKKDSRRIMMFQDVRTTRISRTAFDIRKLTQRTEQIFNYITPSRRYTYRRTKTPNPPKGPG